MLLVGLDKYIHIILIDICTYVENDEDYNSLTQTYMCSNLKGQMHSFVPTYRGCTHVYIK